MACTLHFWAVVKAFKLELTVSLHAAWIKKTLIVMFLPLQSKLNKIISHIYYFKIWSYSQWVRVSSAKRTLPAISLRNGWKLKPPCVLKSNRLRINVKYLYLVFTYACSGTIDHPRMRGRGFNSHIDRYFFPKGRHRSAAGKILHTAGIEPATPGLEDLRAYHYAAHAHAMRHCNSAIQRTF